jgi:enoyl-CoA hydratase/carnithine racemase
MSRAIRPVFDPSTGIATLWLDNPEHKNAITLSMWIQLARLVAMADQDPGTRVLVLRGTNGTFSSGADISEFDDLRQGETAQLYDRATEAAGQAIEDASKPVIAFIEGTCYGGAVSLVTACDLRLAESDSRFRIPAARLGIVYPPRAAKRLSNLVGPGSAAYLLMSADPVDAHQAHQIGLVEVVGNREYLEDFLLDLCENAPLTLRGAKSALSCGGELADLVSQAYTSRDYLEGRQAFREGRRPRFEGH